MDPLFSLTPQPGVGATGAAAPFGAVPGVLGNPIGNAPALNQAAGADIMAQLGGQLSPGTINALHDASATFGVSSGMPGSNLSWNSLYGNIAGAAERQQQQGLQSYGALTGPAFQTGIAEQNALNAAAPNPTAAASHAEQLYNQYLGALGGGGHVTYPGNSPFTLAGQAPTTGPSAATVMNNPDQSGFNLTQTPWASINPATGLNENPTGFGVQNPATGAFDNNSGYAGIMGAVPDMNAVPDYNFGGN